MAEEIELKLSAPADLEPSHLVQRLQGRAAVASRSEVMQRDVYFDNEHGELRAAGLSARVRHKSGGRTLELKPVPISSELVMSRAEITTKLDAGQDPADVLRDLVAKRWGLHLRSRPQPVCTLMNRRRRWEVRRDAMVAELVLDQVRVGPDEHHEVGRFTEVELELEAGSREPLLQLAEFLRSDDLEPSGRSKYLRAREILELVPYRYGAPPYTFDRQTPAKETVLGIARRQLAIVRSYEPGTRVGLDTEHLHKMRVATRRLRSALRVFRNLWPKAERKHLNVELRWLARKLGAVRDLDVQVLAVPQLQDRFGSEPHRGWQSYAESLAERRVRARKDLLKALDDERYAELCRAAEQAFAEPDDGCNGEGPSIAQVGSAVLGNVVHAFHDGVSRFRQTHAPEDAHQLRILGKRLRYTAEFLRPILDEPIQARIKNLSAFQDRLGHLQDMVTAGQMARDMAQQVLAHHGRSELVYVLGILDGAARAEVEHARPQVDRALDELDADTLLDELEQAARSLDD